MISDWLKRRGSAKMVTRGGEDYLWRVYLYASNWGRIRRAFFHVFCMDDPDPLHNHPWDWGRIILWGRYREHYLDRPCADFGPGHVVWRRGAGVRHRVELLSDKVYTIFWHGPRNREWGFFHPRRNACGCLNCQYLFKPAPDDQQDGREIVGTFLPRKIGEAPKG